MLLSLAKNEVFNYWLEKSPDLLLAMRLLEKKETWISCTDKELVGLSVVLSQMSINDLFDSEEELVFIASTLPFSQSMRLISYLESKSPGLLTNLLMLSKESESWVAGKLFLLRLQLIKDYGSFTDVFSSTSSKWVKNLLDNNESSDIKEIKLITLLSQYEKAVNQYKGMPELASGSFSEIIKTFKGNSDNTDLEKQVVVDTMDDTFLSDDDIDELMDDEPDEICLTFTPEDINNDFIDSLSDEKCANALTQEEVLIVIGEFVKTFPNEDELNASPDYQNFIEAMSELSQEVDSHVFPESSSLILSDQIELFFSLHLNFFLQLPQMTQIENKVPLDLRIQFIEGINKEIKLIKSNIKNLNISFPETILNLIAFNQFKHHVTEEGLQQVINAYKTVAKKEAEEEYEKEEKEENEGWLSGDRKANTEEIRPFKESSEIILSTVRKDEQTHVNVELFSAKDIINFKAEHENSKSDVIDKFIQKKLGLKEVRHKTLAKCDNLFKGIDTLYQNFPHFSEIIEYLEDYCHLQKSGDGVFYVPPTLLVGGAGVGKTFFTHDLSKLVMTHFELIGMESVTASWVLVGASSSWNTASPGKIFNTLIDKKNINPIFVLDEIDKCMTGNYPPENTLLPLLEQFTAKNFKDECIPLKIDASNIIWFATANDEKSISTPLKNRFNMFNVPEPNKMQQKALISNIYRKILSNNSWGHNFDSKLPDSSIDYLANQMTSGARDLRKFITTACAKAIRASRKEIRPEDFNIIKNPRSMGF